MTTVLTRLAWAVYNDARDLRFGHPLAGQVPTRFDHIGATDTANSDRRAPDKVSADRITPEVLPADGSRFHLHKPSRAHLMSQFGVRLKHFGRSRGAPLRILYNNCKLLAPIRTSPAWSVDQLDAPLTNHDPAADITFLDNHGGTHGGIHGNPGGSGGRPICTSTGDA